ncbi:MAG TPA: hypothetical protein VMU57_15265 [Edaphobacter sp.]|uniref:hypothetical protein n=1 Tax=Edaphobacter sp. TaxID=1934404 RepID=UPI002BEE238D|nr:hypothetical protein [Edaphobacter sp.]HUZ96264.1 hypothetical protein [Edaphobacter sp.]
MPVRDGAQKPETGLAVRMDDALHGLCQPLTVLQCRLAMGELIGGHDAMRTAIAEALVECTRVNLAVSLMREMLQHELQIDRDMQERMR